MDIKAIRKLPELQKNQEWACEGRCDVIRPKHFENVFSEVFAHDGSSIKKQSEFFWTCQSNHLLQVWCADKDDYILLPEDYYQAEVPKIVESNSIQESINILDRDIDSLKDSLIKDGFLTNEDADILEQLITKAMQLGGFYAIRDAKAQIAPECFNFGLAHDTKINDPKELLFRCLQKMKYSNRFHSIQNWVHVRDLCELGSGTAFKLCNFLNVDPDSNEFKRIEAQEQSHD